MKDFIVGFVGTLCIAGIIGSIVGFSSTVWGGAFAVAIAVGLWRTRRARGMREEFGGGQFSSAQFLCDSCKYNHPSTCSVPDRPNATRCDDYRRRGS